MRITLLTREYPPNVYGGAGVHVAQLAHELARLIDVEVRCFGPRRASGAPGGPEVHAYRPWPAVAGGGPHAAALATVSVDVAMAASLEGTALVHSHTWYANLAGHLAKLLYGVPHLMTSHSLEPLRPWKSVQLGAGGYAVSAFCERTAIEAADAVIAVSAQMRQDILRCYPEVPPAHVRVIHNGIDPGEFRPDARTDAVRRLGIDADRPLVVFVGRITPQKGIDHLLDAAPQLRSDAVLVLCASAPDTEEIGRRVAARVAELQARRGNVVWIDRTLSRRQLVQLLTHATVFCCPSVYEPLGIVNLEAMACETAVVATATGGIPEVVQDGVTGLLLPFEEGDASHIPRDPAAFAAGLADRINALLSDPDRARAMGAAGRRRVLESFTWEGVAQRTLALYREMVASG
ncbi:MAG: glycogen synthase [Actinomycetota bacterium]